MRRAVGSQRFGTHGAHRAQKYVDIVHFYELRDAREYLKSKGCTIYGVSTAHQAGASGKTLDRSVTASSYNASRLTVATLCAIVKAAHTTEYSGSSAFMIDNEVRSVGRCCTPDQGRY